MSQGLTRTERRIMALWDANKSIQQIANTLQLPVDLVRTKVSAFHVGDEHPDHVRAMKLGSLRLQGAITLAQFEAARSHAARSAVLSLDRFA